MNSYIRGRTVRLSVTFYDPTSTIAPVDPVSGYTLVDPGAVTIKVREPDGNLFSVAGTKESQGVYHADYVTSKTGEHHYRGEGTGANASADEGEFFVRSEYF